MILLHDFNAKLIMKISFYDILPYSSNIFTLLCNHWSWQNLSLDHYKDKRSNHLRYNLMVLTTSQVHLSLELRKAGKNKNPVYLSYLLYLPSTELNHLSWKKSTFTTSFTITRSLVQFLLSCSFTNKIWRIHLTLKDSHLGITCAGYSDNSSNISISL